jgi:hypothetical protein
MDLNLSNIMLAIVRIIFMPVKLAYYLIYGRPAPVIVGYCCYTEKEYGKMVLASEDDEEEVGFRTYEEWLELSALRIKEMQSKKWVVIKINVKTAEVQRWLKENNLRNTVENRKKYAAHRIDELRENGIS